MNVAKAAAKPPADREALLAVTAPLGRALFRLVRRLLDDFEEAAPWALLYAPPADTGVLGAKLQRLLELVEQAPQRVAIELELLVQPTGRDEERQATQEAEFFFMALHQMTAPDMVRLHSALDQMPRGDSLVPSRAEFYCELAADLKGKYSSSVMGATAALVSEGRWLGVEVESLLFPEKAEEGERNRRLLSALESTVSSIEEAIGDFPWRTVLASWRRQQYVDRYALADLVALRAHLLRLLTIGNRRALYSGDYHQLESREILLGNRLRELEVQHLLSLDIAPSTQVEAAAEVFGRLHQILLEVAALLDVEALRALIGDELLRDLRYRGASPTPREGTAGRLDTLAVLLLEEDLKIFLKLLVGAVKKRSSIAHPSQLMPLRRIDALPAPPPEPPAPAKSRAAKAVRLDPKVSRAYADRLETTLSQLTATNGGPWQAFQMVHKLQSRLRVLPPALLAEMSPFLFAVQTELLPLVEEASSAGAVPAEAAEALRSCHRRLNDCDLTQVEIGPEVGGDLTRVVRLLDSLKATVAVLRAAS